MPRNPLPSDQSAALPVAMIRGVRPYWKLFDRPGFDVTGLPDPLSLTTFYGEYTDAMVQAEVWCEEHGYYLSHWSDGDDRLPPGTEWDSGALDQEKP